MIAERGFSVLALLHNCKLNGLDLRKIIKPDLCVEGKNEKNSCLSIRAIRGAFAVRSDERSSCEHEHVSSDDLRSVHELHHLNVLLLSVLVTTTPCPAVACAVVTSACPVHYSSASAVQHVWDPYSRTFQ